MIRFLSFAGIFLIITCIIFGILSCDPMYEYDFYVQNTTSKNIISLIQTQDKKDHYVTDTIPIPSDSTVMIYKDESWGQVRNIAQPSDSVPAYTNLTSLQICVINSAQTDSVCYNQDPIDFSKWQHAGVLTGPGKSQYTFIVDSSIVHTIN